MRRRRRSNESPRFPEATKKKEKNKRKEGVNEPHPRKQVRRDAAKTKRPVNLRPGVKERGSAKAGRMWKVCRPEFLNNEPWGTGLPPPNTRMKSSGEQEGLRFRPGGFCLRGGETRVIYRLSRDLIKRPRDATAPRRRDRLSEDNVAKLIWSAAPIHCAAATAGAAPEETPKARGSSCLCFPVFTLMCTAGTSVDPWEPIRNRPVRHVTARSCAVRCAVQCAEQAVTWSAVGAGLAGLPRSVPRSSR